MSDTILVTGATGNVASALVPQLVGRGANIRVLVHDRKKATFGPEVEIEVGDYDDASGLGRAFAGTTTAFLVTPPHPRAAEWGAKLVAAAKAGGTRRIVRLSALKAAADGPTENTRLHAQTEADVAGSGLQYAILRPHFYMQNLFGSLSSIAGEGALYMGMGDGRLGMIDIRDVADVAAKVLLDTRWDGRPLELTGPAEITFHEVARTLATELGAPVRYVPVPAESVVETMKKMGMGEWFPRVMGQYSKAYSENWGAFTTPLVQEIIERPARSFAVFAREALVPAIKSARGAKTS